MLWFCVLQLGERRVVFFFFFSFFPDGDGLQIKVKKIFLIMLKNTMLKSYLPSIVIKTYWPVSYNT